MKRLFMGLLALLFLSSAYGSDWTQWRGPERDGTVLAFDAPGEWPEALQKVWRVDVGHGHASPLLVGNRLLVHAREERVDRVLALNLEDGSVLWQQQYEIDYKPLPVVQWHDRGPFSTPLVHDGILFTQSINGLLSAWKIDSGELLWRRSAGEEFQFGQPVYGASTSPLFVDGKLVIHLGGAKGGALLALEPESGEEIWRWSGDGPPYGSAIVATLGEVRQIVTLTQKSLIGLEAETGQLLWQVDYPVLLNTTAQTPVQFEDTILISAYQVPTRAYRPERQGDEWTVEVAWENPDVSMSYSSPVLHGSTLFGLATQRSGHLFAVDARTGKTLWQGEPRYAEQAVLVSAEDQLLVFRDSGELEVYSVTSLPPQLMASYEVAESQLWAHPALFDRSVLVKDWTGLSLWQVPASAYAARD